MFSVSIVLIALALVTDPVASSFALNPDRMASRNPYPASASGAKHHTHRLDFPGKHKEGAWFLPPNHKPKQRKSQKKTSSEHGGRKWSFGRVPWW